MRNFQLMKQKWFPRPHSQSHSFFLGLERATQDSTIYPIAMYDEGLGTPSDYTANPENATFNYTDAPNCYPESRINSVITSLKFALTTGAVNTDKVTALRIAFMPIFLSFKESYIAIDEKTTNEIQDVLELQTESTDRQGYPLYNGTKLVEKFTNSALMHANVPGLTVSQVLEQVSFVANTYYDNLQFYTTAGKLKSVQGGLKYITLTPNRPIANIKIHFRNKSKFMNPYMFFGVLIHLPRVNQTEQIPAAAEVTNIDHVSVDVKCRYNEWNQEFNFKKV